MVDAVGAGVGAMVGAQGFAGAPLAAAPSPGTGRSASAGSNNTASATVPAGLAAAPGGMSTFELGQDPAYAGFASTLAAGGAPETSAFGEFDKNFAYTAAGAYGPAGVVAGTDPLVGVNVGAGVGAGFLPDLAAGMGVTVPDYGLPVYT
jgi:hypothetical protein